MTVVMHFLRCIVAVTGGRFGAGIGAIFLGSVVCYGTEASILDCPATPFPPCVHSLNDAGVRCSTHSKHEHCANSVSCTDYHVNKISVGMP